MKNLKNLTVNKKSSLLKALSVIKKNGQKCCFVVDNKFKLLGALSDGDARRKILKKKNLNKNVFKFCNKRPIFIEESKYSADKAKNIFIKNEKIEIIPVVDQEKIIKNVLIKSKIFSLKAKFKKKFKIQKKINAKVVIMAGGKGARLDPITQIIPKPLVPIKNKSVIEHIMNKFIKYGMKDFYFTVGYKMNIIKAYFNDTNRDCNIKFFEENKPLGTAGGLRKLIGKVKSNFFVTNCDTIIESNLYKFYNQHTKGKFDISLIASSENHVLPYGVCEVNAGKTLKKIVEKPKIKYLANTGLYIINPKVLKLIPPNRYYNMTDLIKKVTEKKLKIGIFTIPKKNWIDIGQLTEYKKHLKSL